MKVEADENHSTPTKVPNAVEPYCVPISQLSTYTPKWQIKAKVVDKVKQSFSRRPSIGNGNNSLATSDQGCILTCDLMDVEGDVIRSKFWGGAAEKYDKILEKDNIYLLRGGRVNVANKRYNNTPHAYEVTFYEAGPTEIILCEKEDGDKVDGACANGESSSRDTSADLRHNTGTPGRTPWPKKPKDVNYNFVSFRDMKLLNRAMPFIADVIGVVQSFRQIEEFISRRNGELLKRRTIKLVDATEHELEVTLWQSHVTYGDGLFIGNPVVAFRGLQIREWKGKVGAAYNASRISFNPSLDEATKLSKWYKQNGNSVQFQSLRSEDLIQGVLGSSEGVTSASLSTIYRCVQEMDADKHKNFVTVAQPTKCVVFNRENEFTGIYLACPKCKRKLQDAEAHRPVRCENCNDSVNPVCKYLMALHLIDHSRGKFILRSFDESCRALIPVDAETWKSITFKKVSKDIEDVARQDLKVKLENQPSNRTTLTDAERVAEVFEHDTLWQRIKIRIRCSKQVYDGVARNNVVASYIEKLNLEEHAGVLLRDIWSVLPAARKHPLSTSEVVGGNGKRPLEGEGATHKRRKKDLVTGEDDACNTAKSGDGLGEMLSTNATCHAAAAVSVMEVDTAGDEQDMVDTAGDKEDMVDTAGDKEDMVDTAGDKKGMADTAADKEDMVDTARDKEEMADTTGDKEDMVDTAADKEEMADTTGDKEDMVDTAGDKQEMADTTGDKEEMVDTAADKDAKAVDGVGDDGQSKRDWQENKKVCGIVEEGGKENKFSSGY